MPLMTIVVVKSYFDSPIYTVLKWVVTVAQRSVSNGTIANLLSSILTILLTCPNNDTLLCYSNDPLLTSGQYRWYSHTAQ